MLDDVIHMGVPGLFSESTLYPMKYVNLSLLVLIELVYASARGVLESARNVEKRS